MKASVIIPVYNQYDSLLKTLYAFSVQNCNKEDYEVIIVDDGSTDETRLITNQWLCEKYGISIKIVHNTNNGRAYSRNCGVENAIAEYIIFVDCDRVPELDFVEKHLAWKDDETVDIVIGQSLDFFGRIDDISEPLNWETINRFSRIPNFLKRITKIYDSQFKTDSSLVWMSFLVGNSSMEKEVWLEIGGFDNEIKKWGFEHFDFAYRAWKKKKKFAYDCNIKNYHIPHPREKGFYEKAIEENIIMFSEKYPEINGNAIRDILLTNNAVAKYEKSIFVNAN